MEKTEEKTEEKLIVDEHKKGNSKATYAEQKAAKQATTTKAEFDGPKEIEAMEKKIGFVEDDPVEEKGVTQGDLEDLQALQDKPQSLLELKNEISPQPVRSKAKVVAKKVKKAKPKRLDTNQYVDSMKAELSSRLGALMQA